MAIKLTHAVLLTAIAAVSLTGCTNRNAGTGTTDGVKTNNYRPFQYGTGNTGDMRLGFDRYRGTDPDLMRSSGNYHNNTRMESAQNVADQLAEIDPVKSANVLLTDHNAYVAVSTRNGETIEESSAAKKAIADRVQSLRPEVKNVYVSANPDFTGRIQGYVQDLNAGKPVSGLLHEFNSLVQRIFPTNAASPSAGTGTNATGL